LKFEAYPSILISRPWSRGVEVPDFYVESLLSAASQSPELCSSPPSSFLLKLVVVAIFVMVAIFIVIMIAKIAKIAKIVSTVVVATMKSLKVVMEVCGVVIMVNEA